METNGNQTHLICAILDTKAGIYDQPRLFRSNADFIRALQVAAKNPETMFNKFPADYDLCVIGKWSEQDGIMDTSSQRLGSVLDLCPLN